MGGERLHDPWEECQVGPGQGRQADSVYILIHGCACDLVGCLVEPGVHNLAPGVAQGSRHHLGAAIVAVEAGFGDKDAGCHAEKG